MAQTASEFYLPPSSRGVDPVIEDKFRAIEDHLHSTRTFYTGTILPGAKVAGSQTDPAAGIDLTGGGMQSPNFVSGSAGWRMADSGNVEFFNGTFRGTVQQTAVSARADGGPDSADVPAGAYVLGLSVTAYNLGGGITKGPDYLSPTRSGIYLVIAYLRYHLDVNSMGISLAARSGSIVGSGGTLQVQNTLANQPIGGGGLAVAAPLRLTAGTKIWAYVTANAQFDVYGDSFLAMHYLSED